MRLEDEINIKSFRSERQKVHINLLYTCGWMQNLMRQTFDKHGITNQQYNILRILRGQMPKPTDIQMLKARMLDKQPDVSRLVERLVQKGLIQRKTSEIDRRKLAIKINSAGLELLSKMESDVLRFDKIPSQLTDEEVAQLNYLLDKLRSNETI